MPKTHLIFSDTGVLDDCGVQVVCRRCSAADVGDFSKYVKDMYHEAVLFTMDEKKYLWLFGKDFGRARLAYNAMIACKECRNKVCEQPDGKCADHEARKVREK